MQIHMRRGYLAAAVLAAGLWTFAMAADAAALSDEGERREVPREHPRLFGSRSELQELARDRPRRYERVVRVARNAEAGDHARMISLALVSAIERDEELGREAVDLAMRYVDGPIRSGHVPYGHDLARCAIVFDLCYEHWTAEERAWFVEYVNETVRANAEVHQQVFHNGWWGYKHWGIGLACYASYYENDRAPEILEKLERDYRQRAAPALELAGTGGGWAEGYYIHYWLYEWLVFCEVARRMEGMDYYAAAPAFYRQRAVASMFEMYPGISEYDSRRPIPMGDGGGRVFGGDRDKVLSARRILVNRYRDGEAHQVVHAYNERTPRSATGSNAYKDFLWRDTSVETGNLEMFRRSHVSTGPGHVYARSDWSDEATHFFFKASDRFTAHQHLDVGHFLIYRHEELAGDGGHYDGFGTDHDVNYHLRTIAHNSILVHDPAEQWPGIRAGNVTGNDGGQHHDWPHHNGSTADPDAWFEGRELYDIADLLAFEDRGRYLYLAADGSRAYSPKKLERFTRQIVYLRPGTFVIFDRVESSDPSYEKTWLLQAMERPERTPTHLVTTHGQGRLFIQTLLPAEADVRFADGDELYQYGGQRYEPARDTGPAPACRVEISPRESAKMDYFLHVLTATDAEVERIEEATVEQTGDRAVVTVDGARIAFELGRVGGWVEIDDQRHDLAERVLEPTAHKEQ